MFNELLDQVQHQCRALHLIYFNKKISKVLCNFMLLNGVQNINLAILCRDNLRVIEMF